MISLTRKTALLRASPSSILKARQLRLYSSPSSQKAPSPTGEFYKAWTRPVAKTGLIAFFTYQLLYWGWSKLEFDEMKESREAEITRLEALVKLEQQQQQQQQQQQKQQRGGR
ncbi:hypothetical protein QBC42DRAFT_275755 [Cladorrhinum samala]|uniref:Uncharacterized protein n=1 Tax=Cladorrhinum samala TaxID=585594 RepID=A0AAV9HEH0_9PEZI|nr:hypothetical protein QBC42DRAFT_275755 [Cladorrhinum samala]